MSAPLRVVFFGTPGFAVPTLEALLASRHQVVGVVSQPDRPRGRGQKLEPTPVKAVALAAGLPVLQPERLKTPEFMDAFAGLLSDLAVVAAYGGRTAIVGDPKDHSTRGLLARIADPPR